MKRALGCGANAALALLALFLTLYLATWGDWLLGRVAPANPHLHGAGLLFMPHSEERFDMHDYKTVERINNLGFRGADNTIECRRKIRIVAIGDSFTYGWGVNHEDTWCHLLEENLRRQGLDVEVLNLGRPAAGPDDYANIAQATLHILKPHLVLVGMLSADDLRQYPQAWDTRRIMHRWFPEVTAHLKVRGLPQNPQDFAPKRDEAQTRQGYVETARALHDAWPEEQRARFEALEPEVKEAFRGGTLNPWLISHSTGAPDYFMAALSREELEGGLGFTTRALCRITREAEKVHAPVLVLSIPEGFLVNREAHANVQRIGFQVSPEHLDTNAPDDVVQRAALAAGAEFFSATIAFRERMEEKGLYLELDRHIAPKGMRVFADAITPAVTGALAR